MIMMNIRVKKTGADRFRQVLFDNRVQQSLNKTRNKKFTNSNSDNSLVGLEIDWHLANSEMGFDVFVTPVPDYQPTYAHA